MKKLNTFVVRGFNPKQHSFTAAGVIDSIPSFQEVITADPFEAVSTMFTRFTDMCLPRTIVSPPRSQSTVNSVSPTTGVVMIDLKIMTTATDKLELRELRTNLRESIKRWSEKSRVKGVRGWRVSAVRAPKFELEDNGYYAARARVILGGTVFYNETMSMPSHQSDPTVVKQDLANLKRNLKHTLGQDFLELSARHSRLGALSV